MRTIITLCFCLIFVGSNAQPTTLTPQQMQADLTYLNKYLRKWHPTYYAYTSKSEMTAFYDSLKNNCLMTTTDIDFLRMVRQAVHKVGCGHTGVGGIKSLKNEPLAFLPIKFWILNNRLFIQSPTEQDSTFRVGDEILAINGVKSLELIQKMSELAFTDGHNTTHLIKSVEYNFGVFLYFLYGKKDLYELTIKNKMGDITTANIKAETPKKEVKENVEEVDSTHYTIKGHNITLRKMDVDSETMLIDVNSFQGKKQRKTLKNVFQYLHQHKTKSLIIDLRGNGGGSVFKGNTLLNYLLDERIRPLVIHRKPNLSFINPHFKASFWERITPILFTLNPLQYPNKNGWNHCFPFFKKSKNHFDGNIYIITDGNTFSMASYVTSYLKYKKQAIIVGEETGGSEYGSRAMAGGSIQLPHSKVKIKLNVYQMTHLLGIQDSGHGVIPDYSTPYDIEDKLKNRDLELEKIKSLISKN